MVNLLISLDRYCYTEFAGGMFARGFLDPPDLLIEHMRDPNPLVSLQAFKQIRNVVN